MQGVFYRAWKRKRGNVQTERNQPGWGAEERPELAGTETALKNMKKKPKNIRNSITAVFRARAGGYQNRD